MTDPALANLIREVLAEELARMGGLGAVSGQGALREERVRVASDEDLAALVQRVLALADDPAERKAFDEGRLVFRLAGVGVAKGAAAASLVASAPATGGGAATLMSGVLTERQIDALPSGTAVLSVGKSVRVTPLAKDRLRQRGIRLERTRQ